MKPFADTHALSVAALGERALIEKIRDWLGAASPKSPNGIGDDCAVLPPSQKRPVLITTDPVIFGRHFDGSLSPEAVAQKLLKRNLSDIAAMGGTPRHAVVSLNIPKKTATIWLQRFYKALAKCAQRFDVKIVGGDVAETANDLCIVLTLLGEQTAKRSLTRTGAQLGDRIFVTGSLGGSIRGHHWKFTPRLSEGQWLAARRDVRALIDLSDGLAKDIAPLTPVGCRAALFASEIPIAAAAKSLARVSQKTPLTHALCDGEDFELLFVLSSQTDAAEFIKSWAKHFRTPLHEIGFFAKRTEVIPGAIDLEKFSGYEHLG